VGVGREGNNTVKHHPVTKWAVMEEMRNAYRNFDRKTRREETTRFGGRGLDSSGSGQCTDHGRAATNPALNPRAPQNARNFPTE
jgi:hypothetical protein